MNLHFKSVQLPAQAAVANINLYSVHVLRIVSKRSIALREVLTVKYDITEILYAYTTNGSVQTDYLCYFNAQFTG